MKISRYIYFNVNGKMSGPNTDFDAAQALLDLQGTLKLENSETYRWCSSENREDIEKTANLFWNCFISSDVPVSSCEKVPNVNHLQYKARDISADSECSKPSKQVGKYNNISCKTQATPVNKVSQRFKSKTENHFLNRRKIEANQNFGKKNTNRRTREVGTQTEECYFNPNIELMDATIKKLCERIQSLETQLKESDTTTENATFITSESDINRGSYESQYNNDYTESLKEEHVNESNSTHYTLTKAQKENGELRNQTLTNPNVYPKRNDLVPIGDGHASVPARLLKHINWNSYTSATRKLLTAVFSRRILATHSLTGKPSPAFPNKPAKKKLDPTLVNDIVQTVVERCSVPENVVRTSITTKCADESKMLKTRQIFKEKRSYKRNRENVPPTTSESESENY